ncbi:hypothetical protein IMY05_015G0008300 [Salix suchowensis]|nr:hypothetical protein IMY05_015G0008300 [Salix suchowensis]
MSSLIIQFVDFLLHERFVSAGPVKDMQRCLWDLCLTSFFGFAKMGGGNPELVVAVYLGEKWWGTLPL